MYNKPFQKQNPSDLQCHDLKYFVWLVFIFNRCTDIKKIKSLKDKFSSAYLKQNLLTFYK